MGGCCSSSSTTQLASKEDRALRIKTGAALLEHIFTAGYAQQSSWLQRFFAEFAAAVEQLLNINGFERNDAVTEMLDAIYSSSSASTSSSSSKEPYISEEERSKKQSAKMFMRQQWKSFTSSSMPIEVDSTRVMITVGWLRFDKDSSGGLDPSEIEKIVVWLNVDASSTVALKKRIAARFKATGRDSLSFVEFSDEFDALISWDELDFVFYENAAIPPKSLNENNNNNNNNNNANAAVSPAFEQPRDEHGEPMLNYTQLGEFLFYVQDEQDNCWEMAKKILRGAAAAKAVSAFSSGANSSTGGNKSDKTSVTEQKLDKRSFMKYLTSRELNSILDLPKLRAVYQDMDQPLSAYFISASHNTYLTGHQLTSESSADMYRKVLREGCRSVELDCWDGADGQPIVYHGYTLTTKITFASVIDAVADSGFIASEYAISLSLDLNLSVEQQRVMVQIMKAKLGDRLLVPGWFGGDNNVSPNEALLSKLKGKVLVKAKRIAGPPPAADGEQQLSPSHQQQQNPQQQQQNQIVEVSEEELQEIKERQQEMNKANANDKKAPQQFQQHPHLKPMARELSDLVWMEACNFKSFPETTPLARPHQCTSFSEVTSKNFCAKKLAEYVEFNKRHELAGPFLRRPFLQGPYARQRRLWVHPEAQLPARSGDARAGEPRCDDADPDQNFDPVGLRAAEAE
jgi:hypothetical protein